MIGRLILFAMIVSCSHVVGQDRVYITNVASDKAKKIYFDQYSNDTRNWVHFINNPHKAEIKVYLKETCFQADIEVVSHIDLKADWVMITQHAHEADARIYLSSYYNADAKGIYITENPYDADVTICLNKDEYLKGYAGGERQERLQKLIAAVMYERMFVPDTGG